MNGLQRRDKVLTITGIILTTVIFVTHHSLIQYLTIIVLGGLTGLFISKDISYFRKRDYKKIIVASLSIILFTISIILISGDFGAQCMMAVTGTAYDPVNQECVTEIFTCDVEFPWYFTDCPQSQEELCEDPEYFEENRQGCQVVGVTPEEEIFR